MMTRLLARFVGVRARHVLFQAAMGLVFTACVGFVGYIAKIRYERHVLEEKLATETANKRAAEAEAVRLAAQAAAAASAAEALAAREKAAAETVTRGVTARNEAATFAERATDAALDAKLKDTGVLRAFGPSTPLPIPVLEQATPPAKPPEAAPPKPDKPKRRKTVARKPLKVDAPKVYIEEYLTPSNWRVRVTRPYGP